MNEIKQILEDIRKTGASLAVNNGNIELQPGLLPLGDTLLNAIRENKQRLMEYISKTTTTAAFNDIPRMADQDNYVLSSSQRRLWLLSQIKERSIAYNMPGAYIFEGQLNKAALEQAFDLLVRRHEILRTVFREDEKGDIKQFVIAPEDARSNIKYDDLTGRQEQIDAVSAREVLTEFDLAEGPLWRAAIYTIGANKWLFIYTLHHIISDGWSMEVLIKELLAAYNAACMKMPAGLQPLPVQYRDYASWQQQRLRENNMGSSSEWWRQHLSGPLPVLSLPVDKSGAQSKSYQGDVVNFFFNDEDSKALKKMCRETDATLFMGLMALINTLFFRYTEQEDIIVGCPVAGRDHPGLAGQIGCYINTLALRTQFSGDMHFPELLQEIRLRVTAAFRHQEFPFDELVQLLDEDRKELFTVMMDLKYAETAVVQHQLPRMHGVSVERYPLPAHTGSKFDFIFHFSETATGLALSVEFNTDKYFRDTVLQMCRHLQQLMKVALAQPSQPLYLLNYLDDEEKSKLLPRINEGYCPPLTATIPALFRQQAGRSPNTTALVADNRTWTYGELDDLSERMAVFLQRRNLGPRSRILLFLDRSPEMIVAILAVLKLGAVYIPLDITSPPERLHYLITDTAAQLLITSQKCAAMLPEGVTLTHVLVEDALKDAGGSDALMGEKDITGADPAYIIYTSGSTGRPKGVIVTHHNVVSLVTAPGVIALNSDDRVLQWSNYVFDGSVYEIFGTLLNGASLHLISAETAMEADRLGQVLVSEKITVSFLTTALFNGLVDIHPECMSGMRKIIFGGEKASVTHTRKALAHLGPGRLVNAYGPTETTVFAVVEEVNCITDDIVPIGMGLANCYVLVLDKRGQLVPAGVPGEVFIGGRGVAAGYLNLPEQSAERFITDPLHPEVTTRLYRTGDLARWLPDGRLLFSGRRDNQVKIRGYRIEPGEIEHVLMENERVDRAVVLVKDDGENGKCLVAWFTGKMPVPEASILTWLRSRLPEYMIPALLIQLDEFPLTANGKTDKRKLRLPETMVVKQDVDYAAPANDAERALADACEEVLRVRNVSMKANFIALGGDSIKAIRVVARLRGNGFRLTIGNILAYPVLEDMAARIKIDTHTCFQGTVRGSVPLSPVQTYFFRNHPENNHHFNQSVMLSCKIAVDTGILRQVLNSLLHHHDALRMIYRQEEGIWQQENRGEGEYAEIEVVDNPGADITAVCDAMQATLDPGKGLLFKAVLFRNGDADKLLLISHHLIIDAVSWRILLEDINTLYYQYLHHRPPALPLKTDSFRYWVEKLGDYSRTDDLLKQDTYWAAIAAQVVPPLPSTFPDAANMVKDQVYSQFTLTMEESELLFTRCYTAHRTEINDILLTAVSLGVSEIFSLDKLLFCMEGHGREQIDDTTDVSRTVGWFTSMYPVVIDMQYREDMVRQLIAVKEKLHRIPDRGIGYGVLCYIAGKEYDVTPEMSFNYLGDFSTTDNTEEGDSHSLFSFTGGNHGRETDERMARKFLLDFSGMSANGQLQMGVSYSSARYSTVITDALLKAIKKWLQAIIAYLSETTVEQLSSVDFTYKDLSIEQLEKLNQIYG
ncbi:non-ribosomal peptide synthase domain TIGR01720/amino acid adenylation domain-containing protein [Chitinophaga eiseniae]|uniref:Non-ribosomal peptide synthase domain TIGR01720/amino acid adenylation domain-containing protein n=1 Tax=Chitinophaga eiseniae TaxID=634771 RepID=A0A1T4U6B8_9BACT|nr:non-ribosomal peptide synthetase [Chitinophaga eiseniae]SKA48322.1 non-ribosomal peptide synthase domain TIGR01720/amino acid adenylation domain-containing protein [Chitinophaga eiseniae]